MYNRVQAIESSAFIPHTLISQHWLENVSYSQSTSKWH